ncbi:MAG: WYL domain-containing protein [Myxococcales bacterium]|nr:WYL domain-containing protein [Myxococcota bacterium]MDW8283405.1 WYL domain-containing protein [Myxococcales bacterium]
MPSARDGRTKRLLDLVVLLLDTKQPVPFSELREQFPDYRTAKPEAGLRAFERDKATLLELGVPLRWIGPEEDNDLPPEGGYIIDRQRYRMPEVSLSADEVAALVVTAAAARHQPDFPYRHAAELAVRKLMFDLAGLEGPGSHRRRQGAGPAGEVLVHMPTVYRSGSLAAHLQTLEEAVRFRKRVTILYDHHRPPEPAEPSRNGEGGLLPSVPSDSGRSNGPQRSSRQVDPYGLVYRQGAWLLVGHCHQAGAVRRFRVDRILELHVAPRPRTPDFEVPPDFSLQAEGTFSPWRFDRGPRAQVQLFISHQTPWVAREDFGPCTQRPAHHAGTEGVVVEFSCANLDYLMSRVLGSAGALRVLSPEALRRRIAEAALRVARRNEGQSAER